MQLISVGLLSVGVLIAAGSPAHAQARATGADIRGLVQDSSGGRLAGSGITARNRATNIARAVVADMDGRFVIPALEPGAYDVRAELDGFSPSVREGLVLQVGEVVDLPFSLEIAPVEQTVRVEAGATAVNPTQTAIATIIGRHEIDDLPLNGRRFIELAALSAGVTTGGPVDPAAETSGLSVLGQRPVSNNLMVDGFDNNDRILGGPSANFSQESVAEFQVLVGSYPAEFGNATGGIVNIVTRSGSNVPGGTAFVYGRDTALNARGHFEKVDPFGNANRLAESDVRAVAVRRLVRRAPEARPHLSVRGVREDADLGQQHRDHRRHRRRGADRRRLPRRDGAGALRAGPRRAGRARRPLLEAGAQPVGACPRRRRDERQLRAVWRPGGQKPRGPRRSARLGAGRVARPTSLATAGSTRRACRWRVRPSRRCRSIPSVRR